MIKSLLAGNAAERDRFEIPKSVQKSIPIKRIYKDGVFQVSGKYSKSWRFYDVNYAVASLDKQMEMFMAYCAFLNSLPINAGAKITLFNRKLNPKEFSRSLLMKMTGLELGRDVARHAETLAERLRAGEQALAARGHWQPAREDVP